MIAGSDSRGPGFPVVIGVTASYQLGVFGPIELVREAPRSLARCESRGCGLAERAVRRLELDHHLHVGARVGGLPWRHMHETELLIQPDCRRQLRVGFEAQQAGASLAGAVNRRLTE